MPVIAHQSHVTSNVLSGGREDADIFMPIKLVVHMRCNRIPRPIYTSASFFLIAGVICTLCIVYKGFPELGLDKKPCAYNAAVTLDIGGGHTNKGYLG